MGVHLFEEEGVVIEFSVVRLSYMDGLRYGIMRQDFLKMRVSLLVSLLVSNVFGIVMGYIALNFSAATFLFIEVGVAGGLGPLLT
jgi:hypothetical protein